MSKATEGLTSLKSTSMPYQHISPMETAWKPQTGWNGETLATLLPRGSKNSLFEILPPGLSGEIARTPRWCRRSSPCSVRWAALLIRIRKAACRCPLSIGGLQHHRPPEADEETRTHPYIGAPARTKSEQAGWFLAVIELEGTRPPSLALGLPS